MSVTDIVDVQISIQDQVISRAGFGTGLIMGSSSRLSSKVEEFADLAAVSAVYTDGDPELVMATRYFGQEIKPTRVFMAQRDADVKQKNKILITALQDTTLYSVTISIEGVTAVQHDFTSDADATRAEIVTGLIAAINLSSQATLLALTDNGDDFDIESAVAGDSLTITVTVNLSSQLLTANINISTELALIEQANNDWYMLLSVDHTDKNVKRAANFIQGRVKTYLTSSQNADIISPEAHVFTVDFDADFITANVIDLDIDGIPVASTPFDTLHATTLANLATNIQLHARVSTATVTGARQITVTAAINDVLLVVTNLLVTLGASQATGTTTTTIDPTTDLGAELKALSLDRTALIYSGTADTEFIEGACSGLLLPEDAGSITWAFKTLSGVTVSSLTSTQKSKALGNNVNTYTSVGGADITQDGKMASGRFIDIRRGTDALQSDMTEKVFSQFVKLKKIPYTDAGITIIDGEVRSSLSDFQDSEFIARNPAPTVTVPLASGVSSLDRIERLLPDVKFTAQTAGAIHKAEIRGTISI